MLVPLHIRGRKTMFHNMIELTWEMITKSQTHGTDWWPSPMHSWWFPVCSRNCLGQLHPHRLNNWWGKSILSQINSIKPHHFGCFHQVFVTNRHLTTASAMNSPEQGWCPHITARRTSCPDFQPEPSFIPFLLSDNRVVCSENRDQSPIMLFPSHYVQRACPRKAILTLAIGFFAFEALIPHSACTYRDFSLYWFSCATSQHPS